MTRVLVIEDNTNNLYLINLILKNHGFEVINASTGEEGILSAIREKPDLILVDIQLPDIDGLAVTRRIRESEEKQRIPIIAITSYAMSTDRQKAFAAGCTGYIEKPINPDTIIGEIVKFLE